MTTPTEAELSLSRNEFLHETFKCYSTTSCLFCSLNTRKECLWEVYILTEQNKMMISVETELILCFNTLRKQKCVDVECVVHWYFI